MHQASSGARSEGSTSTCCGRCNCTGHSVHSHPMVTASRWSQVKAEGPHLSQRRGSSSTLAQHATPSAVGYGMPEPSTRHAQCVGSLTSGRSVGPGRLPRLRLSLLRSPVSLYSRGSRGPALLLMQNCCVVSPPPRHPAIAPSLQPRAGPWRTYPRPKP